MNLLEINVFILGFENPGAMKWLFSRNLWSRNMLNNKCEKQFSFWQRDTIFQRNMIFLAPNMIFLAPWESDTKIFGKGENVSNKWLRLLGK